MPFYYDFNQSLQDDELTRPPAADHAAASLKARLVARAASISPPAFRHYTLPECTGPDINTFVTFLCPLPAKKICV
jgi:hypothetical protein